MQAQAALNESQAQLQQVTDAVPALIARLDKDHRYRFANKAFLDWHGVSQAELLGRLARDVSGISAFEHALPSLERVLQGERTSFQVELVHRSGESRFVQMDCVPEHAADGSVVGYICMGSDVSVLKQAELALREDNQALEQQVQARTAELRASKRRLQAIFESSFQHQVLLDLSGRVVDANDASLAAVLADKKDIVGQRFGESLWFANTDGVGAVVDQAVAAAAGSQLAAFPRAGAAHRPAQLRCLAAPAAGRRRRGHRRGIGGGGNHCAAAGRACASPVAEDRGGRPAHRRHRT